MEIKHACKLCYRSFANGRALGGHMRSHVSSPTTVVPPKPTTIAIRDSSSSSSSSSFKAAANGKAPLTSYKLRENPKRSTRLIVEDFESDTESTRQRRSKRVRRTQPESEPVSSVSTATAEEDVAISLMLLSRDIWHKSAPAEEEEEGYRQVNDEEEEEGFEEDDEEEEVRIRWPVANLKSKRSSYQCGTCKKVFRSYQALGGHRASHKRTNGCAPPVKMYDVKSMADTAANANGDDARRIEHECPVCYRVFSSGQALGGHKRSHLTANSATAASFNKSSNVNGETWIDLNLPAPMEDDAELSAVCDA